LGVKKFKIGPESPKTEFGAQNQYYRQIYPSTGNFTWSKKNVLLEVKKVKISLQSPKTKLGFQNQYDRVILIYPSIRNFTWSKKKYTFVGQKVENRPQSKTEFGAKIQYGRVIDREFYRKQEKINFWESNCENKPSEPKNGT
jgi:hypothetical protein